MKVVVTADIHYGVGNNQHIVKNLAKKIIKTKADVLILAGDTFHFKQQLLIDCLKLFDTFKGDKLFVPGNHDLWTNDADSLALYEKILPKIVKQCGFHYLDQKPFIKGGVGFGRRTGEIIKAFPKVKFVFCGHTHQKKKALINGITAINIGSDYLRKRFEIIDV